MSDTATAAPSRPERIAGVAKLWGAIRMFHPYIASRQIDWDAALVEALPPVLAADSDELYREAVAGLLSHLDDPATRVLETGGAGDDATDFFGVVNDASGEEPKVRWVDAPIGRVGILAARDTVALAPQDLLKVLPSLFKELEAADAIVFDGRSGGFLLGYYGAQFITGLFDGELVLPGSRTRMHVGHAPDAGGAEMYYSAFVVPDGQVLNGRGGPLAEKPLAFIVGEQAAFYMEALGLQAAGRARIVWAGDFADAAGISAFELPGNVFAAYRTGELVNPDGSIGVHPDAIVANDKRKVAYEKSKAVNAAIKLLGAKAPRHKKPAPATMARRAARVIDPSETYPSVERRMLGLFHYWNTINYHFPYADLMERDWDEVLIEFIPRIEQAGDATEYALAMAECNANINDTHGFLNSPAFNEWLGSHTLGVQVRLVEGETVITHIAEPIEGLTVGDVVVAIDGEKTADKRARLAPYFAASTPHALVWRIDNAILNGADESEAVLDIQRESGERVEVRAKRTAAYLTPPERQRPVFEVLPEGYGYIDLARLTLAQVNEALDAVRETPALIFDMRGYPNGTAWAIAPRLATSTPIAAQFRKPIPRNGSRDVRTIEYMEQRLAKNTSWRYEGQVVTLIYAESISQAEHTCLFIEAATEGRATFIGSATNGANGDVTSIVIPGAIRTSFSGHDVRHADGSQLQRKGIQPHIHVEPTIKGIREGRDEVLERAVEFLQGGGQR